MKLTKAHLTLFNTICIRGVGRICNDLEPEEEALLTPEQWKEFSQAYHTWNGDPEEFAERTNHVLSDFMVESYIRARFIAERESER